MSELILCGIREVTIGERNFIDEACFYDYIYQLPSDIVIDIINTKGFDNQMEKYLGWVKENFNDSTYESHRKSLAVKIALDEVVGWKFWFSSI